MAFIGVMLANAVFSILLCIIGGMLIFGVVLLIVGAKLGKAGKRKWALACRIVGLFFLLIVASFIYYFSFRVVN